MKKRFFAGIGGTLAAIVIALFLLTGCDRSTPEQDREAQPQKTQTEKVSVRMKWFFAGTMTGWFAGKEQGIFARHGIDLAINPGGPDNSSVKLVAAGTDTFGVAGADEVLLARSRGMPIVAIGVLFKHSPICFISRAEAGITTPAEWKKKRIEVSYGENAEYQFRALTKKFGLAKNDYMEIPYTFNVLPFVEKKVDVSPAYAMDQAIILENRNIKLTKIFAKDYGIDPYADVFIVNEGTLKNNPDLVRQFMAAVIESQSWAIANPAEAVKYLVTVVRDMKADEQLPVWKASIPFILGEEHATNLGLMKSERWEETKNVLIESGVLVKPVNTRDAYTNDFLPARLAAK